jgi:RNA polymerase sigma factor (sigma-70 family)
MAWLVRVTRNRLLQWHRGNRRRRDREIKVGESVWFDCEILNVDQRLDAREVTAALIAMSSPQREVIVMHLWGDMTFESIAEVIGVSRATAHRAFTSGLETLRAKFSNESKTDSMRTCNE